MMFRMVATRSATRRNSPWHERNHGRPRPYVAHLTSVASGTAREFIPAVNRSGGHDTWVVEIQPGDAIEARTNLWDSGTLKYRTGTAWIIHDGERVQVVGRDEAFAFVMSGGRLSVPAGEALPALPAAAERMLPAGMELLNSAAPRLPAPSEVTDATEA